ncbi:MAG: class I SAM-dependent methyltransferase [Fimbriimonadales bacterium]
MAGRHLTDWAPESLEFVNACPACGARTGQAVLYRGLHDKVYRNTPGTWDFYRCEGCGSGYFNPRPTPESIGKLYEEYYTHAHTEMPDYANLSLLGKIRRLLGNGYRNHRFGMRERPASMLGVLVAWLMPNYRALLNAGGRHLPKRPKGRLLDVGCGNGDFLQLAQRAGWQAVGVEPDPKAVAIARARGLTVHHGGLETLSAESETYDGITMNHVIEHVHDPRTTLTHCYRLLKPGGWLWLETPNLDAQGHARYGENWVGLDIPRHLVVFTDRALRQLLKEVGFARVERLPYYPLCERVYAMSRAIATGESPHQPPPLPPDEQALAQQAEANARRHPEIREFVMVRAWKA